MVKLAKVQHNQEKAWIKKDNWPVNEDLATADKRRIDFDNEVII